MQSIIAKFIPGNKKKIKLSNNPNSPTCAFTEKHELKSLYKLDTVYGILDHLIIFNIITFISRCRRQSEDKRAFC